MDLDAEYARVLTTPSDIQGHLKYLHDLAIGMNAQRVIELGVRHGTSTIAWLHALEQTGGWLYSVDINPCPAIPFGTVAGWEFHQGSDMDPTILGCLPTEVDIVFIDTDHLYDHTLAELDAYVEHVRPGGVIVCHDTELEWSPFDRTRRWRYPVRKAIERWVGDRPDIVEWRSGCYGMATIHL